MEYGGTVLVKRLLTPLMAVVNGTFFFGSVIELESSGLLSCITVTLPEAFTLLSPFKSIFTGCAVVAVFIIFK